MEVATARGPGTIDFAPFRHHPRPTTFVSSPSRRGAAVIDPQHRQPPCRLSLYSINSLSTSGRPRSTHRQQCAVRCPSPPRPGMVQATAPSCRTYILARPPRLYHGHSPRSRHVHSYQLRSRDRREAARHASSPLPRSCASQRQAPRVAMACSTRCACSLRREYWPK
jgi:hypothetical protein